MCIQETRAPLGAALPIDQPFVYDGPQGIDGCEAGFLVKNTSPSWSVSSRSTSSRFRWRCLAPALDRSSPVLVCSFYAPHVGMSISQRVAFWSDLRVSIQEVLQLYPRCEQLLAGDCNVYMGEVMGSERERSGEPRLRELIRGICADFQLEIANPVGVPTHCSGSSIDLVLVSRRLAIRNVVVHDGSSCACPESCCCPVLGSDHKLITFQIALTPTSVEDVVPCWSVVRDWRPVVRDMRVRLLTWSEKVMNQLREAPCSSVALRRAILDVLYSELVAMLWQSAPSQAPKRSRRRPQPDWWDDECYDVMVGRNAAWRRWCRERTPEAQEAFRAKRLQFHHLVRKQKARFWHSWLRAQERMAVSHPAVAARNVRRQLGVARHSLPPCMRNASPEGGCLEGNACVDAWRCHFRDVPASAAPSVSQCDNDDPDFLQRLRNLREAMSQNTGQFDFAFSEPELLQVLQELPANRAPGPDGLTYEVFRVDDDIFRAALLCFFELVRSWAIVPSVWRTAVIKPLHKSGSAEEFTNYRPISLLCCNLKIFERLVLKRLLPHIARKLMKLRRAFVGVPKSKYTPLPKLSVCGDASEHFVGLWMSVKPST